MENLSAILKTNGNTNAPIGSSLTEKNYERVCKQYGQMQKSDVYRVVQAEREARQCENCAGLPCKKKFGFKGSTPYIFYDSVNKMAYVNYQFCNYEKQRRLMRSSHLANIPAEYLGKTFADYQVDAQNSYAVEVAKKLVELPDKGAFFYGGVGTGKTFLAAIIAQEAIQRGRTVIFATVPTISAKLRATFNKKENAETEADILDKLCEVPTLIFDDVGLEKPTRFICSTICNIFNERYNAKLQTIMTSNYSLKELAQIFNHPTDGGETYDGTRIYDRCKQMCVPVEIAGKSRRN